MSKGNSKIKRIFSGFQGYDNWMKTVISVNQYNRSEIAQYRLKVIKHYKKFGLKSTLNAFPVKRSTVYLWQSKLKKSGGQLCSLVPKSTKPDRVRQMQVDPKIIGEIRRLRQKHYRLGKKKLKPLIDKFCQKQGLKPISISLIGKVINRYNLFFQRVTVSHNPNWKKRTQPVKIRVKRAPKPIEGGYIETDTVEKRLEGIKRYTISFIDVKLKIAHSKTFTGKLSKYTLEAFQEFEHLMPINIKTVQNDNGSEFEGVFKQYLKEKKITQVLPILIVPRLMVVLKDIIVRFKKNGSIHI